MYNDMEIILESTGALVYIIGFSHYEILYTNNISKEEFGMLLEKLAIKSTKIKFPCGFCPFTTTKI